MCDAGLIEWLGVEGAAFFYEFLPISMKVKTLMHISYLTNGLFFSSLACFFPPSFDLTETLAKIAQQ